MFDGKLAIQEEFKAEHPCVDEEIDIFSSSNGRVEWDKSKKITVGDHVSAENKRRFFKPRIFPDYLLESPVHTINLVPASHPGLDFFIYKEIIIGIDVITSNRQNFIPILLA